MKNKFISMLLLSVMTTSLLITSLSTAASASTFTTENTTTESFSSKEGNPSIGKSTIKIIEEKYLIQNSDGTFSLSDDIYNEFDEELVNFVKNGMNSINSLIVAGNLNFKINNEKQVINTYANDDAITSNSSSSLQRLSASDSVFTSYDYCSNYTWYWYGFECSVNKDGTRILKTDLEEVAKIAGWGAAAYTALVGPHGLAIGLYTIMTLGECIYQCELGLARWGVYACCLGAPSSAAIVNLMG